MAERSISGAAAVVGIATTQLSRDSGRTEYSLACEAIKAAVDDAGIGFDEIDALVKDDTDGIDPMYVQKAVGIDNCTYASESHWGTSSMVNAVTAIAAGVAKCAVYYRSVNGASLRRAGTDFKAAKETKDDSLDMIRYDFHAPFGLSSPAGAVGMTVRRYLHDHGIGREDLGWVPVVCSEHAARNPEAVYFDAAMTIADYSGSAVEVDPMRKADCAPGVDGALAVVITSAERAADLAQTPARILAATQGTATNGGQFSNYSRAEIAALPEMRLMGDELFRVAGVGRADMDVAQIDDQFGPFVPMQLEELGFCGRGEGADFCAGGDRIRLGGDLPINTDGGALGRGHIYGLSVVEAVRQIRGSSANQVKGAELALVSSGAGGPADGLILAR